MRDLLNCPNCGAPIQADVCPYCGAAFLDWAAFGIEKPNYVKIKLQNRVVLVKAYLSGLSVDYRPDEFSMYADNSPVIRQMTPAVTMDAHLICMPFQYPGREDLVMSVTWDMGRADQQTAGEILKGIYQN